MKSIKIFIILLLVNLATGCSALFMDKTIPIPQPPTAEQLEQKPNVLLKVRSFHGTPQHIRTGRPMWNKWTKSAVANAIQNNQLFNSVVFDDEGDQTHSETAFGRESSHEQKPPYTVEIGYYEEIDYDQVGWSIVKSTFTLLLIPFHYDQYVTMTLKVYDDKNNLLRSDQNSVSAKTWTAIWMLPLGFFYNENDLGRQEYYQIETLLFNAIKSGVFQQQN